MENLIGRKVKAIRECVMHDSKMKALIIGKEYEIKSQNGDDFTIHSEVSKIHHFDINELEKYFELVVDEPQFKQGDKVLYTDDLVNWDEGTFLVKHNENYIVESDEMLLYAIEIKPYEEEIKVGDWVKYDNQVFRVNGKELSSFLLECIKITNPQLIELLNKEL